MDQNNTTPNPYVVSHNSDFVESVRTNIKSDVINITEDKLENILLKNLAYYNLRFSWLNPLGIFLAFLLAELTSTFNKEFLGVTGNVWEAFFLIGTLISGVWLLVTVIRVLKNWKKCSLTHILDLIKNTIQNNQLTN